MKRVTKNLWVIWIGLASIADGICRVASLGFWSMPRYTLRASTAYAKWDMRLRQREEAALKYKNDLEAMKWSGGMM